MNEDEASLLRRFIQSGDAEAFAEISRLHAGLVYGACLRVTGDEARAADAAQETFFHFLKHARQVTGSLAGWLHRVAVGKSVDLVRSDVARRRREQKYAAQPRETDLWSEISPLVDEALLEIDEEARDLLVRHYLQGETLTDIAVVKEISQPTASRRAEQAVEQLRARLKTKGVLVAAFSLSGILADAATSAPAHVLMEVGKMALTGSGAAAAGSGSAVGLTLKLAVAAVATVLVLGVGGWIVFHPKKSVVRPDGAPSPAGLRQRQGWEAAPAGQGRFVAVIQTPPADSRTPEGAVQRFVIALASRHLAQIQDHFVAGSPGLSGFQRLMDNPQDDQERALRQSFLSLGPPVVILESAPEADGLRVKCRARVGREFTLVKEGQTNRWRRGDTFELELRLKQVGDEWRIAGF